eukprot:176806-Amphidinium_carterae.1
MNLPSPSTPTQWPQGVRPTGGVCMPKEGGLPCRRLGQQRRACSYHAASILCANVVHAKGFLQVNSQRPLGFLMIVIMPLRIKSNHTL